MERADRGKESGLLENQPYDESLEVPDPEEVASVYSPTPRTHRQVRSRKGRGLMSGLGGGEEEEQRGRGVEPQGVSPEEEEEEDEEEDDDDSDEEEDSEDEEEQGGAPEGAYDPSDYANLPVSSEIRDLFQYITRFSPQTSDLDHSLKPFIPDYIPAVGDIDAFLKVPRPDGKADHLGLVCLDEPSVKQSDPTVLSLWLSEESKQHGGPELKKVSGVCAPHLNPRALDSWVDSIGALHRSKPPASVQYARPMPDLDSLMQEWPPELEEALKHLSLPPARLRCSPAHYADIVCCLLDVPVYSSRIQALHLVFSLYLEFRDSLHFSPRA